MIKNYNNYLLLESLLQVDKRFDNIISYMADKYSSDKPVYNILLNINELFGIDIKTDYNGLSVSNNNTDIQFIPDSKYKSNSVYEPSYKNISKSSIKIGRLIRKLFKDNNINNFTDSDFEKFVNAYKATYDILLSSTRKIEVVKGDDILYWYDSDNYFDQYGQLGNSCMSPKSRNEYMKIYSENPDVCSMIILTDSGKLLGRALLWKLDNNKFCLDRIYTRFDSDIYVIEEYAKNNYDLVDEDSNSRIDIEIKKGLFDKYPYVDTFYAFIIDLDEFGYPIKYTLSNDLNDRHLDENKMCIYLRNTNGTPDNISNHTKVVDLSTNKVKFISRKYVIYIDKYSKYFDRRDSQLVRTINDNYDLLDNCVYSDFYKGYISKDNAIEYKGDIVDKTKQYLYIKNVKIKYLDPIIIYNECKNKNLKDIIDYEIFYDNDYNMLKNGVSIGRGNWITSIFNSLDGDDYENSFKHILVDKKYIKNDQSILTEYKVVDFEDKSFIKADFDLFFDIEKYEISYNIKMDEYLNQYKRLDLYLMLDLIKDRNDSIAEFKKTQLITIESLISENLYRYDKNTFSKVYTLIDKARSIIMRELESLSIEYIKENEIEYKTLDFLREILKDNSLIARMGINKYQYINSQYITKYTKDIELIDECIVLFYDLTTGEKVSKELEDVLDTYGVGVTAQYLSQNWYLYK